MKTRALMILPALLGMVALVGVADGASIIWAGTGAADWEGNLLEGVAGPGTGTIDLSKGALVQLWKAVGGIDDPEMAPGVADPAYLDPNYSVDDILLDQAHIGCGYGPPGAQRNGVWSRTVDVSIIATDEIYVRGYNTAEGVSATQVGIRDTDAAILSTIVERVDIPVTYTFENLQTEPVPEPASLLLLVPGLAVWAIRRKK